MDAKTYTEKYEYVSEMVQVFIDGEEKVYAKELTKLFSDESWHVNFFEFNLSQLVHKEVESQLTKLLDIGGTGQVQYNTALARVKSLFVNIAMAIGEEYLEELEKNCVVGLVHLCDSDHNKRRNIYKTFQRIVSEHPEILVASIGSAYFQAKHTQFIHRSDSQKSNRSGVTPQSLLAAVRGA